MSLCRIAACDGGDRSIDGGDSFVVQDTSSDGLRVPGVDPTDEESRPTPRPSSPVPRASPNVLRVCIRTERLNSGRHMTLLHIYRLSFVYFVFYAILCAGTRY